MQTFFNPNSRTNSAAPPALANEPQPSEVTDDLMVQFLGFNFLDTDDHVTVRLALPAAPAHSNGKWNEARKLVEWDSSLETAGKAPRVPVFCYANWVTPDETAQKQHFGRVLLAGDELSYYCLWRGALEPKQAAEWEAWLAALQPGEGLKERFNAFHFTSEPVSPPTNAPPQKPGPSEFPRQLLNNALETAERESAGKKLP